MEWFSQNAALVGVAIMPLTYGFVGWFTNLVALKMTFYPLKFIGIWEPWLGWQGIVPRKASGLALKSVQMLTEKLFKVEEFFEKVDAEKLYEQFKPVLPETVPEATRHIIDEMHPKLKSQLQESDIEKIIERACHESEQKLHEITGHLKEDIGKVFNFKTLVLRHLTGDNVHRIVDIFQAVGHKEFKFIEKSGLYFGALLGGVQIVLWHFFPLWWTLPIQGVIVGYLTNWLALTMIFRPLREKSFGFIRYQGLFLKRQTDVADKYAELFATQVLSARNIMDEILYRRVARSVVDTIQEDVAAMLKEKDPHGKMANEIIHAQDTTQSSKKEAIAKITEKLSGQAATMEKIMGRAMNVRNMIFQRMKELPPEDFEPILRTAFQEDEYILILLGAVLGALVGLGQGVYMFIAG
ncbi:MAG: DUF445 family protein [Leptospiraceae bacterium]|nr:DUF445 family protein [Leptospiraceae bacterium]